MVKEILRGIADVQYWLSRITVLKGILKAGCNRQVPYPMIEDGKMMENYEKVTVQTKICEDG